jgi:hypothetical protein
MWATFSVTHWWGLGECRGSHREQDLGCHLQRIRRSFEVLSIWECDGAGWAEGDFSHALDFEVTLVRFVRFGIIASGQLSNF